FDKVEEDTVLLHTSEPRTQPWKKGLLWKEGSMNNNEKSQTDEHTTERYHAHPLPRVEHVFLSLLNECLKAGTITENRVEGTDCQSGGPDRPDPGCSQCQAHLAGARVQRGLPSSPADGRVGWCSRNAGGRAAFPPRRKQLTKGESQWPAFEGGS